jgi:hypothetical protein
MDIEQIKQQYESSAEANATSVERLGADWAVDTAGNVSSMDDRCQAKLTGSKSECKNASKRKQKALIPHFS